MADPDVSGCELREEKAEGRRVRDGLSQINDIGSHDPAAAAAAAAVCNADAEAPGNDIQNP